MSESKKKMRKRAGPAPISTTFLIHVGEILYGDRWQASLARDLGISERAVHYLAAGETSLSDVNARKLLQVVKQRAGRIEKTLVTLHGKVTGTPRSSAPRDVIYVRIP